MTSRWWSVAADAIAIALLIVTMVEAHRDAWQGLQETGWSGRPGVVAGLRLATGSLATFAGDAVAPSAFLGSLVGHALIEHFMPWRVRACLEGRRLTARHP